MPIQRFSSRHQRLYDAFLAKRLPGALSYDRIAGYFQSSLLDLAAEELKAVPMVRIVCNTEANPVDVHAVRQATGPRRCELQDALLRLMWNAGNFPHLVDVYGEKAQRRLRILQELVRDDPVKGSRFQIRIVPDSEFGFVHGKGGVIRYGEGRTTSFIGSANDSHNAWAANYELVWEDDDPESVQWIQEEFDALWEKGFPMSEFIVSQIERLGQRSIIEHVGLWREKPQVGPVLAEVPTCTQLFGFWEHQKSFISRAFEEHKFYVKEPGRGARYLLADGVGLGKTLQLGGLAKLIGSLDDDPILIVAPKPVLTQWQQELIDKLATPSGLWTGDGWLTERDEFHPSTSENVLNCPRKIAIIPTSIVLSATRSPLNGSLTKAILQKRFSCVLWDEAHKIRRTNLREPMVWQAPRRNLLYEWAMLLAARARTIILATATPVQLHPIELWDLLSVLSVGNPQVLGSDSALWRQVSNPKIFNILTGRLCLNGTYEKWEWWKDPMPREDDRDVFRLIRNTLGLLPIADTATNADFDKIDEMDRSELAQMDLREFNPFTIRVIKRSRERLEEQGKLVKIEMFSVDDERPVVASHSICEAIQLSEDFARLLHRRIKGGGFIKTLLQRRVGSSVTAGLNTAQRMLAGNDVEDEDGLNEESESIYPLESNERELLKLLCSHLTRQLEYQDPKFERVWEILTSTFEGVQWIKRGTLIFTQYYDSAYALCEFLAAKLHVPIGLYGNSQASKLFDEGKIQSIDRELLKEKVMTGVLMLLVGTDAASTGLNLQRLGCLINLDLPWNPIILEQRKGRVQRGVIAKRVPYCNLRYDSGVEQRLFDVLTGRIEEITQIFGTIPDFITDHWITEMLENRTVSQSDLVKQITGETTNPFTLKEAKESIIEDWENTREVLNSREAFRLFLKGW